MPVRSGSGSQYSQSLSIVRSPLAPPQPLLTAATMDLNSLKDSVSNLTLYDIKAGVRKVQNGK